MSKRATVVMPPCQVVSCNGGEAIANVVGRSFPRVPTRTRFVRLCGALLLYCSGKGDSVRSQFEGVRVVQYLVSIFRAEDYEPAAEDNAMANAIDVLNREMTTAGIRIFVGGLHPASDAQSLRASSDGEVLITEGPYLTTKEYIGGFWVIEVATLAEALVWARKAVIACRASVEVRPFH